MCPSGNNGNLPLETRTTTAEILSQLLELQAQNNDLTRPDWRTANFNWLDAVMVEAVEGFDSLKWKWWKHGDDDVDNLKMEIIDMWHFIMSWAMVNNISVEDLTTSVFTSTGERPYSFDLGLARKSLRSIINTVTMYDPEDGFQVEQWQLLTDFGDLVASTFSCFDEFVKLYIAKNTLNRFRQANGYKDGSYVKIWTVGDIVKEDNHFVHIYLEAVTTVNNVNETMSKLHNFLDSTYQSHVAVSGEQLAEG